MSFYPDGFSFQDFDLLIDGDIIYASFIKKVPYFIYDLDSKKPNRYSLAKSIDGVHWEEVGDMIMPVPNTWEESIWAGSIRRQENKYVIYYTGVRIALRNSSCKIGKAYSLDLIHWTKDLDNPVLIFEAENPYYSGEPELAFRDPFPFEHEGRRYIIFCAKDKSQPACKQGGVGIVEETSSNQFKWMPPLFSPGIYLDGLECPALYKLQGKWYLLYGIDDENKEKAFRYAIGDNPFGPFIVPQDNQLLPTNNYNCRIVQFKGRILLYYWSREIVDGMLHEKLALPKEVHIRNGKIVLSDFKQTLVD